MAKTPSFPPEMPRRASIVKGGLVLGLLLGLAMALPIADAQSTVLVTIPSGAASPSGAPGYSPDTVTVVIGVNNTVTWMNNDTAGGGTAHTVTPVTEPTAGNWSNGSGNLPAGMSYTFTFTVPGTYFYDCIYHTWMTGSVIVKAPSSNPAPEFPAASLPLILFAVIAATTVAVHRLRPGPPSSA